MNDRSIIDQAINQSIIIRTNQINENLQLTACFWRNRPHTTSVYPRGSSARTAALSPVGPPSTWDHTSPWSARTPCASSSPSGTQNSSGSPPGRYSHPPRSLCVPPRVSAASRICRYTPAVCGTEFPGRIFRRAAFLWFDYSGCSTKKQKFHTLTIKQKTKEPEKKMQKINK